jgi:hypothetical protein
MIERPELTGRALETFDAARTAMARVRADYSILLDAVNTLVQDGIAGEAGYPTARHLLKDLLNVDTAQAREMVDHAELLHSRRAISGSDLPASLPATADALGDGAIGAEHVRVIAKTLTALPDTVAAEDAAAGEAILAQAAHSVTPHQLRTVARELELRLDPDGTLPTEHDLAKPHRRLNTTRRGNELWLSAVLDNETGHKLEALLDPLARPRPSATDGLDTRLAEQRYGDAFADIIDLAINAADAPSQGGEAVHLYATVTLDQLRDTSHPQTPVDFGVTKTTLSHIQRLACDVAMIPVVLNANGAPAHIAIKKRLADQRLRRAAQLRDGPTCAANNCTVPASRCHFHHITPWAAGGPTTLNNGTLLCPHHHRMIHHAGWTLHTTNNRIDVQPPHYLRHRLPPATQKAC